MAPSLPGCFGKIRAHADFIRHNAEPFHAAGLEPWLDQGMQETVRAMKTGWDQVQRALTPQRFLYLDPRRDLAFAGILAPSYDKVGRRFPLLIFAPCDARIGAADTCVAALEFFGRAEELATLAERGLDASSFKAHVGSLRSGLDRDESARRLAKDCDDVPLTELAEVLGDGQGPAGLIQWLANAAAAFANGTPSYVLHSRSRADAAWPGLLLRLLRAVVAEAAPRLAFWERPGGPGASGRLRLFFAEHVAGTFVPLVFPGVPSERAWDVGARTAGSVAVPDRVLRAAERLVGDPDARTSQLITALEDGSGQPAFT
jgi:type VI secretion system ImpM family protein